MIKLFIINSVKDDARRLQEAAYETLTKNTVWTHKPEIFMVDLGAVIDWMPIGHVQTVHYGSLHIMYNYEGDLTEDIISIMQQIENVLYNTFKQHPSLGILTVFSSDSHNDETDTAFLSMQNSVEIMRLSQHFSALTGKIEQVTQRAIKKNNLQALKIIEKYEDFVRNAIIATNETIPHDERFEKIENAEREYNETLATINREIQLYTNKTIEKNKAC